MNTILLNAMHAYETAMLTKLSKKYNFDMAAATEYLAAELENEMLAVAERRAAASATEVEEKRGRPEKKAKKVVNKGDLVEATISAVLLEVSTPTPPIVAAPVPKEEASAVVAPKKKVVTKKKAVASEAVPVASEVVAVAEPVVEAGKKKVASPKKKTPVEAVAVASEAAAVAVEAATEVATAPKKKVVTKKKAVASEAVQVEAVQVEAVQVAAEAVAVAPKKKVVTKKKAVEAPVEVTKEVVEAAPKKKAAAPKKAVVAPVVVEAEVLSGELQEEEVHNDEDDEENDAHTTITYKGVEYYLKLDDNSVYDKKTQEFVGEWDAEKLEVEFQDLEE